MASPTPTMASPTPKLASPTPAGKGRPLERASPATLAAKAMLAQINAAGAQASTRAAQIAGAGIALALLVMCFVRSSQTA